MRQVIPLKKIKKIVLSISFIMIILITIPWLQAKTISPVEKEVIKAIKLIINQFIVIASDKKISLSIKRKKIKKLYYNNVSLQKFAKSALRRDWKSLNKKQQKEYSQKFNKFVVSFYLGKLEKYENGKIIYGDVKLKSSGRSALIKTLVKYNNTPISLSYYMSKEKNRWYIYDFAIEGVRISSTYYGQFKQVLKKGGYKELNKELNKLLKRSVKK